MNSVFESPNSVKEVIEKGMAGKLQEGEIDELEFSEIESEIHKSPPPAPVEVKTFELRGDHGSGEGKKWEVGDGKDQPPSPSYENVSAAGGTEEGPEHDDWTSSRDGESRAGLTPNELAIDDLRRAIDGLRHAIDDKYQALNAVVAPLAARVQRLEAGAAMSVPIGHGVLSSSSPPRQSRPNSVGMPRLGSPPPGFKISEATIAGFLSKNRSYPSIQAIRTAKLRALAALCGVTKEIPTIGPAEWTVSGLKKALTEACSAGALSPGRST